MQALLSSCLSPHIEVRGLYLSIFGSHLCPRMFTHSAQMGVVLPKPTRPEKVCVTHGRVSPVSLLVWGGSDMNKTWCGRFYILLFHHKNLNFPFCGKQKHSFCAPSTGLWLWITVCPQEILKIHWLGAIRESVGAPLPLFFLEEGVPTFIPLIWLPPSCVDEEIDWSRNDL